VALPALQTDLKATVANTQWVIEHIRLLPGRAVAGGRRGWATLRRRRVFSIASGFFAPLPVWCGLAADVNQLIAARAAQDRGRRYWAQAACRSSAPIQHRARGQAIAPVGFSSITTALGPVLGASWWSMHPGRWVFFINVPLAAAVTASCTGGARERGARAHHGTWTGRRGAGHGGIGSPGVRADRARRSRLGAPLVIGSWRGTLSSCCSSGGKPGVERR